jgi:hypothetical protein
LAGEAWSDEENDAIVAAYFDMLALELAGERVNKAERNRLVQTVLADRSRGSVEFKHQNVSAVMLGLGQPWIDGYKPMSQFQDSLVDAVMRRLDRDVPWAAPAEKASPAGWRRAGVQERPPLWIGPTPTVSNAPPPIDPEAGARLARRFDVAGRDAANKALGDAGEEMIYWHERETLERSGRHDLSRQVRWTAREDGDGAGYDIASFEADGQARLIEVKTTNGWDRTPFHITRNELAVADARRDAWVLLRLWNFAREPKAFELRPPLDAHVALTPTSFAATFP